MKNTDRKHWHSSSKPKYSVQTPSFPILWILKENINFIKYKRRNTANYRQKVNVYFATSLEQLCDLTAPLVFISRTRTRNENLSWAENFRMSYS